MKPKLSQFNQNHWKHQEYNQFHTSWSSDFFFTLSIRKLNFKRYELKLIL